MSLTDLLLSATAVVIGSMFLVVGISYLAYKIRKKSPYQIRS